MNDLNSNTEHAPNFGAMAVVEDFPFLSQTQTLLTLVSKSHVCSIKVFEDFPEAKIFRIFADAWENPRNLQFYPGALWRKALGTDRHHVPGSWKKKGSPCLPFASAFGRCQLVLTAANCFIDLHGF